MFLQAYGPNAAAWCLNLQASGLVHVSGAQQNRFAHVAADIKRLRTIVDADQVRTTLRRLFFFFQFAQSLGFTRRSL